MQKQEGMLGRSVIAACIMCMLVISSFTMVTGFDPEVKDENADAVEDFVQDCFFPVKPSSPDASETIKDGDDFLKTSAAPLSRSIKGLVTNDPVRNHPQMDRSEPPIYYLKSQEHMKMNDAQSPFVKPVNFQPPRTFSEEKKHLMVSETLVMEHFEGAFPPPGWSVVDYGGDGVWESNQVTGRTNYAGGDGFCAVADSDWVGSGTSMDTGLRTPPLDFSQTKSASLDFYLSYNDIGGGDYAEVRVTTDNGSSWNSLLFYDSDHHAHGPGEHVVLNLSAFVNEPNVVVEFHYVAPTWDWWYEVDQVNVTIERKNGIYLSPKLNSSYAYPGDSAHYVLTALNTLFENVSADILSTGNSWTTRFWDANMTTEISSLGPIPANGSVDFIVEHQVAPGSTKGDFDMANITIISQTNSSTFFTSSLTTHASWDEVVTDPFFNEKHGTADKWIEYSIQVKNNGSEEDNFTLSLSDNAWTGRIIDGMDNPIAHTGPLASGEVVNISVEINIPTGALPMDEDFANLTATSQNDPTVSDVSLIHTICSYGLPYQQGFEDGFEDWDVEVLGASSPATEWEHGDPSGYGPGTAYEGVSCAGTNLVEPYYQNADITLTSPPLFIDSIGESGETVPYQMIYEDFDDGAFPPEGWTLSVLEDANSWSQYNDSALPLTFSEPYCAGLWWSSNTQDEWLIMPELDLTYNSDAQMTFESIYYWGSPDPAFHNDVVVSLDGGISWITVAQLLSEPQYEMGGSGYGGSGWNWNEGTVEVDLAPFSGEESVMVGFHFFCNPPSGGNAIWMVDDVSIHGNITIGQNVMLFENWFDMETMAQDGGFVEVSVDGGSFERLEMMTGYPVENGFFGGYPGDGFSGTTDSWRTGEAMLNFFLNKSVRFRFHFASSGNWSENPGWYLDDFYVGGRSGQVVLTPKNYSTRGLPNHTYEYTFEVFNNRNTSHEYDLLLANNTFPGTIFDVSGSNVIDSTGTMAPFSSKMFKLVLDPEEGVHGSFDESYVTVVDQTDPLMRTWALTKTEVGYIESHTLPEFSQKGELPGEVVTHEFAVTNTGDLTETFDLMIFGDVYQTTILDKDTNDVISSTGPLASGMTKNVIVLVQIPFGAQPGEYDQITLRVQSRLDNYSNQDIAIETHAAFDGHWYDDFEEGWSDWKQYLMENGSSLTRWEVGNPDSFGPGDAFQGDNCAGTNLISNYEHNADAALQTPFIKLPSSNDVSIDVLIVTADWVNGGNMANLYSILNGFSDVNYTLWDVGLGTPSSTDMLSYDVVLIGGQWTWASGGIDRVGLSNNLADYVDAGGKVVASDFIWYSSIDWNLQGGRFIDQDYSPFEIDSGGYWSGGEITLGAYDSTHPLMTGVTTLSDTFGIICNPPISSTGTVVASWSVGEPLLAYSENCVGINLHLMGDASFGGDVDRLLYNALWYNINPSKINNAESNILSSSGNEAPASIENPSFETGDLSFWNGTDLSAPFFSMDVYGPGVSPWPEFFSLDPTDGNFALATGFDGNGPGHIRLEQETTIDAPTSLKFDYRVGWDTTYGATKNRHFNLSIEPAGGGEPLFEENVLSVPPQTVVNDTGNLTHSLDLNPFLGSTVRIVFDWYVSESNSGPALFQLDNIIMEKSALNVENLMRFNHWFDMESQGEDGGFVEINDNTNTWKRITPLDKRDLSDGELGGYGGEGYSGTSSDWKLGVYDLYEHSGKVVSFRFHFASLDNYGDMPGWYLDAFFAGVKSTDTLLSPPAKYGKSYAGDSVFYVMNVKNNGTSPVNYSLNAFNNAFPTTIWDDSLTQEISTLGPIPLNSSAQFIVEVSIPSTAPKNQTDLAYILVESLDDGANWDMSSLYTTVGYFDISCLSEVSAGYGTPYDTVNHSFLVKNTGTLNGSYSISASGGSWPIAFFDASMNPITETGMIGQGETMEIVALVEIPSTAQNDQWDVQDVKFTSLNDASAFDTMDVHTRTSFSNPWYDGFEETDMGGTTGFNWTTNNGSLAEVNSMTSHWGDQSMCLHGGDVYAMSHPVNLSSLPNGEMRVWVQPGNNSFSDEPENGEPMYFLYLDENHTWQLMDVFDGWTMPGGFNEAKYVLPADALHEEFRVVFFINTTDGANYDYYHIDDFYVGPPVDYSVDLQTEYDNVYGQPGERMVVPLNLKNLGNLDDSYTLSVSGNSWAATVSYDTFVNPVISDIPLVSGTSTDLYLHVQIPADADPGDMDDMAVLAVSTNNTMVKRSLEITVQVVRPILVVDDDFGLETELWYLNALDGAGYRYDYWEHITQGTPSPALMNGYEAVIWFTGNSYGDPTDTGMTFDGTDRYSIRQYLIQGGKIYAASSLALYDAYLANGWSSWFENTFQAYAINFDSYLSNPQIINGTASDPIGDGLSLMPMTGDYCQELWEYYSVVGTFGIGEPTMHYSNVYAPPDNLAMVKWDNDNARLAYSGFDLADISGSQTRQELLDRTVNWLLYGDPPEVIEVTPGINQTDVPINNEVTITYDQSMRTEAYPYLFQTGGTDNGGWSLLEWRSIYQDNDTAVFIHNDWMPFETVELTIHGGRKFNNLPVEQVFSWSFTTGCELYPPEIGMVQANGQSHFLHVERGDLVTLTATVDDRNAGGSDVASSNFTLGEKNWPGTGMDPSDGAYDSPYELVEYVIDTTPLAQGIYEYYVYGSDQWQNNQTSGDSVVIYVDEPDNLTVTYADLANPDVGVAGMNHPFLALTFEADNDTVRIQQLNFTKLGTLADGDILGAYIHHDTNGDGIYSNGDALVDGPVPITGGTFDLSLGGYPVDFGEPETFIITLSIAHDAPIGDTVGVRLGSENDVFVLSPDNVQPFANYESSLSNTTIDNIPPQVEYTVPYNNAYKITTTTDIVVAFSETMDQTSVESALSITPSLTGINYTWSNFNATLTIVHDPMFYLTTYTVSIDGSIAMDMAGLTLDGNGDGNATGVGDSYSFSFMTRDPTPPTSNVIASSLDGYYTTDTFSMDYQAQDNYRLSYIALYYRYSPDGTEWGNWREYAREGISGSTYSGTFDFDTNGMDGHYGFMTLATDRDGNIEAYPASADAETMVDTNDPTSSTVRMDGITSSSSLEIEVVVDDTTAGVESVALYYSFNEGPWVLYETLYAPFALGNRLFSIGPETTMGTTVSFTFDSTNAEGDGSYGFCTVATDSMGNEEPMPSSWESSTVIDSNPPDIFDIDDGGVKDLEERQVINATVTDAVNKTNWVHVTITIVDPDDNVIYYGNMPYQDNIDLASFETGPLDVLGIYHYQIVATDNAGHSTNVSGTFEVTDMTDPQVFIPIPSPDPVDAHGEVRFRVHVTDNDAVNAVFFEIRSGDGTLVGNYSATNEGYWHVALETFHQLGEYAVVAHAVDDSGNWNTSSQRTFSVTDMTAPSFNDISFDPATGESGEDFTITADVWDEFGVSTVSCKIYKEGELFSWDNLTHVAGDNFTHTWNIVPTGYYDLELTATDIYGNADKSTIIYIVEDTIPPVIDPLDIGPESVGIFEDVRVISSIYDLNDVVLVKLKVEKPSGETFHYTKYSDRKGAFDFNYSTEDLGDHRVVLSAKDRSGNWAMQEGTFHCVDATSPTADAGGPSTVGQGEMVTFGAYGSQDNYYDRRELNFTWEFNGETYYGIHYSNRFMDVGNFTIVLTVTDPSGNSDTDSTWAVVTDTTAPTIEIITDLDANENGDYTTSTGSKVTVDAGGSSDNSGIQSYEWTVKFNGRTQATYNGSSMTHKFNQQGKYTVNLKVQDDNGNAASTSFDLKTLDRDEEDDDEGLPFDGSIITFLLLAFIIILVAILVIVILKRSRGRK